MRKRLKLRQIRWRQVKWMKVLFIVVALFLLAPIPAIALLAVVNPPMTSIMMQQSVKRLFSGQRPILPKHDPISREQMSPLLRRAVLASEDDRFYLHHGVDFVELQKTLDRRRSGGSLRGASTLSQQVAKNIFLWNGRSFFRKGLELYIALLIELILSKERILDLYLNLAEWGNNVYGAEAAARAHFGRSAANLSREQAARLAAILPAPRRWTPNGTVATRRSSVILSRMRYAAPKRP